jgi:hypothetical protein
MPGLVPGIHVFDEQKQDVEAGASPAMTKSGLPMSRMTLCIPHP